MSDSLFNTPSETATRLTLCLSLLPHPATLDEITVMDFAATYMKVMGLAIVTFTGITLMPQQSMMPGANVYEEG